MGADSAVAALRFPHPQSAPQRLPRRFSRFFQAPRSAEALARALQ